MNPASPSHLSETEIFRAARGGLLLLTGLFLTNFISRLIFAPFLPVIENELGLSHGDSGSFFLLISAGYFISIVMSGFVSAEMGHKRTIILSTLTSGFFLIILSWCESLLSLRIGLFFLGLSAGLYLPSGIASVAHMVPSQFLARGMAIHELAPNIAFVAVPMLSTLLLARMTWGQGLAVLGSIIIGAGLLYGLSSSGDESAGIRPNFISIFTVVRNGQFWFLVLLFSLGISSTLGLYTMLPLFLVTTNNFDLDTANTTIALSRFCSIFMPILGGWAGDRFGHRNVVITVLLCSGFLTMPMGFVERELLLVLIFLQPMVAVCFFPSGFSILTGTAGGKGANLLVSLCIPAAFLTGGGIIPTLIGLIGDHFSLALGFSLAGLACAGGAIFAARSWRPQSSVI